MYLITCEHASRAVPLSLAPLFAGQARVLASHRGHDIGGLEIAVELAGALAAPLMVGRYTRLVVDLNRSESNPEVFSEFTNRLAADRREDLLERLHRPHRDGVERLALWLSRGSEQVVHLSVHTFTPVLDGNRRDVDIGLLYDPSHAAERRLSTRWLRSLRRRAPDLGVKANRPYLGTADGLTAHLRGILPHDAYLGIEIEVTQALSARDVGRRRVAGLLLEGLPAV